MGTAERGGMETREHLERLFAPRSLALIGATGNLGKWGGMILANVLVNGYQGRVFPVNPRGGRILGLQAFRTVAEIPGDVDLACIVTPAATVHGLVEACARRNIRTVLVISSNFSETGDEGRREERALADTARRSGVRLVGPNSMGVTGAARSLVCMMAPLEMLQGDISLVSQSGNIGIHMMAWGKLLNAGFRHFVCSGNEADLTAQDYLRYFGQDPRCRSVMIYMESIKGEESFLSVAREVTCRKPVVVFKGGRSPGGQRAAASHSAALAGRAPVFQAAFRQAGLIQAATTEGFIDCGRLLARLPLPRGNRVGILTRGGGWGVIATDACEQQGLSVPALAPGTLAALDRLLPAYWSRGNPVDMAAVPGIRIYLRCAEVLLRDPNVDGLIALGAVTSRAVSLLRNPALKDASGLAEGEILRAEEDARAAMREVIEGILALMREEGKPAVLVGSALTSPAAGEILGREGLDLLPTPERAVRVMARLMAYAAHRRRVQGP